MTDQLTFFGLDLAAPNGDHSVEVAVRRNLDNSVELVAVRELSCLVCVCGNAEMDGRRCRFGASHHVPWCA